MGQTRTIKLDQGLKNDLDETQAYHTLKQIKITKREQDYVYERPTHLTKDNEKSIGQVVMAAESLLAFGKKVWEIISAGKPSSTSSYAAPISVLPAMDREGQAFYEMENWSVPRVQQYDVVYENMLGMEVVSFTYGVYYQSGGTYEGTGSYLTGVNVNATNIKVAWGFKFNATSELVSISNMGTKANPNAAATININYTASSFLQTHSQSEAFHITGTGHLTPIQ